MMRNSILWVLASLHLMLAGESLSFATGTGGGNPTFKNEAYDFQVAAPSDWTCQGCPAGGWTSGGLVANTARNRDPSENPIWSFRSPENAPETPPDSGNQISVTFFIDYDAHTVEELGERLGAGWMRFDRGEFRGWANHPDPEHAPAAEEYYFVAPRKVILIKWNKDESNPPRAYELSRIRRSIRRASLPPHVRDIRIQGEKDPNPREKKLFQLGERACFLVGVDNLDPANASAAVTNFHVSGQLEHWEPRDIAWNAETEVLSICMTVTSVFGTDGLQIKGFSIFDGDRRSAICRVRTPREPQHLSCDETSGTSVQVQHELEVPVVSVENSHPDREGPLVRSISCDSSTATMTIDAQDPAGIMMAEVFQGDQSTILYSDQLMPARPASLIPIASVGWNLIDVVIVYDRNGNTTVLREPAVTSKSAASNPNLSYEIVPNSGASIPTDLAMCTFFKQVEGRQ